jgi:periplasmic divalent cation tolerance protein
MDKLLLVYTTWENKDQAYKAGEHLLKKRLCGCINIYPDMVPLYWWPPKENKLEGGDEVTMIIKTLESKYKELEKEIYAIHPSEVPCIITITASNVNKDYFDWIKGEVEMGETFKKP